MQCSYIHSIQMLQLYVHSLTHTHLIHPSIHPLIHPCHGNASIICTLSSHNPIYFHVRPLTRPLHPQAYLKNKDVEAQLGFTESIRPAPEGSTVLPLAYGNRSAVLYQPKKYKVSQCHNHKHPLYCGPFCLARVMRGALRCNPLESGWIVYGAENGYNFSYGCL